MKLFPERLMNEENMPKDKDTTPKKDNNEPDHLSYSSEYLTTTNTLQQANIIRSKILLNFEPRLWAYVMRSKNPKNKWDIYVSSEVGSRPSSGNIKKLKTFVSEEITNFKPKEEKLKEDKQVS